MDGCTWERGKLSEFKVKRLTVHNYSKWININDVAFGNASMFFRRRELWGTTVRRVTLNASAAETVPGTLYLYL